MITHHQWEQSPRGGNNGLADRQTAETGSDRRAHRRHDLEPHLISVERVDGRHGVTRSLGKVVDLSAGGLRIRTEEGSIQPDQQIRVRLELPDYAGICPFIDTSSDQPKPSRQWVGWMAVARVKPTGENSYEVAGRLVDMDEMDRGMLGLYLSTQPLAA